METLGALGPLLGLVLVTSALRLLGGPRLRPWPVALRGGLATLFTMTGVAHFVGMRAELVAMVPPQLPAPELLVTVTGLLELAGVVGLLVPRTARLTAGCLTAFLVAVFPANVYAAMSGLETSVVNGLVPRTLMQIVFLAATLVVALKATDPRRAPVPASRA